MGSAEPRAIDSGGPGNEDKVLEFFVSFIVSYPERWRDGPCETLATC
jgi:hypothetical protein